MEIIKFRLTHDLVPILYNKEKDEKRAVFICPIPKGFKEAIKFIGYEKLNEIILQFIKQINDKAGKMEYPFINIMSGYYDRTKDQKQWLLDRFKLTKYHLQIDREFGLMSVMAGSDINSGDIFIEKHYPSFHWVAHAFEEFFDEEECFLCHNVDYYWQSLLTRELCIQYFNYLREIIEENELKI